MDNIPCKEAAQRLNELKKKSWFKLTSKEQEEWNSLSKRNDIAWSDKMQMFIDSSYYGFDQIKREEFEMKKKFLLDFFNKGKRF